MLAELPQSLPALTGRALAWIERRRVSMFVTVLAVAAAGIAAAFAARSYGDAALFEAPLHPSQAREIQSALTLWNETYSSDAAGTQVYVPATRRRDVLLRLTLAGLPRPFVPTSADMLAEPASAMTPRSQLDDRRRIGIAGDLTETLRRISGVADANVILTPEADDPFALDPATPPSAAVQVILQPNAHLEPRVIDGIRRLVAAAVAGLTPEHVTVTDSDGALLDGAAIQDPSASRETRLQSSVQSALDAVLGSGASVVRVRVVTAGADVSLQSTRITPHGLLDADAGREHGHEAARIFDKERHVQHYAYDTDVERRTTAADSVRRISVAVILDARRVDSSRRDDVAGLVRAAAGADLGAGDTVVVAMLPFATRPSSDKIVPAASQSRPLSALIAIPAAAACALAMAGAFLRRRREMDTPPVPAAARDENRTPDLGARIGAETPRTVAYLMSGMPPGLRARVLLEFDPERRSAIEACIAEWSDDR
ncbi:MAG TPA: flagellar M-ring protein FliF C-terminal domain-containing protein [Candidatus Eremiobacteraceae bacterium]